MTLHRSREYLVLSLAMLLGGPLLLWASQNGWELRLLFIPIGSTALFVFKEQASLAASLTPAQRRVLTALCRPYRDSSYAAPPSNQQIADELVLTVHTVKGTLRQLFDVFDIRGISQNQKRCVLAERALQTGVISRREL